MENEIISIKKIRQSRHNRLERELSACMKEIEMAKEAADKAREDAQAYTDENHDIEKRKLIETKGRHLNRSKIINLDAEIREIKNKERKLWEEHTLKLQEIKDLEAKRDTIEAQEKEANRKVYQAEELFDAIQIEKQQDASLKEDAEIDAFVETMQIKS